MLSQQQYYMHVHGTCSHVIGLIHVAVVLGTENTNFATTQPVFIYLGLLFGLL